MKKLLTRINKYYHFLYLGFLFVITIFLLFLIFPGETRFKYEFQKGSPWRHSTLIAPFNFAVLKSDAEFVAERDSVFKSYLPYFKVDILVTSDKTKSFSSAINTFSDTFSGTRKPTSFNKIVPYFNQLYADGILAQSVDMMDAMKGKSEFMWVQGNQATRVPVSQVRSLKSAYQSFNDSLRQWTGPVYSKLVATINISDYFAENLFYDVELNAAKQNELNSSVSLTKGMIQAGERIIFEGDMVGQEEFMILESLKKAYETKRGEDLDYYLVIFGKIGIIVGCLLILFLYLLYFRIEIFNQKRHVTFIFMMIVLMVFISGSVLKIPEVNIFMVPLALLPILIRIFFDSRTAIFALVVTTLLIGFFAPNNYEYILLQLIAGIVSVFSLNRLHRRSHLVITAFWVVLTYCFMYIALSLVKEGNMQSVNWRELKWFGFNGMLIMLAYPLIWVFEKIFHFISDVTLMELSDTNQQPLLRQLDEEAPGTFQHSRQVANISEEVIRKIGGNPHLVRAGALYHDIGKLRRPGFFIENQIEGMNPHDRIDPKRSAEVVIDHVTNGIRLARKHNLPQVIVDFITTHHGTTKANYFYRIYQNENPEKVINADDFSYPGPVPTSKECAIVMLTDGIEAASRALKDKTYDSLRVLIEEMVNQKIVEGQLDNADLTFREIAIFKQTILTKLKNIYHLRIEYPK